jgi:peptide/nickel transport system permease protein
MTTTETLAAADTPAERSARGTRARARNTSMLRTIFRSKLAIAGMVLVLIFILVAILGSTLAPYSPSATSSATLQAPSASHLLGTTQTGQDVLSELLVAAGPSLAVGFLAAAIATALSIIIGVAGGYFRGFAGDTLSSFANVFLVVPSLPLIIVLAAYLPTKSVVPMAIVISVTGWAWGARLMRVQTLSLRQRDHIVAARAIGERTWRIMFVELMPGLLPIITSAFLFTVVFAIVTQAGLAFLGLTDISTWSWGTMLYWSQNDQAFTQGAWWWYVPPGLCIALLGMGMGLINFALDEIINPRLRDVRPPRRSRALKKQFAAPSMSNQQGR